MSFLIYFDESNKLDSPNKIYSYYGAYGFDEKNLDKTINSISGIYDRLKTKSEMHFNEYSSSEYVIKYFQVLDYIINQDININILIVNNDDAYKTASQMSIDMPELRDLFYVKIPERLFYGLTRKLDDDIKDVKIIVDDNSEYDTLNVYDKLQEQMNAHSAYRNKSYKVLSVKGKDSKESIPLQVIDTFMGMIVFLMEESYYENTISSRSKSDLIYRLLIEGNNLELLQNQVNLYRWEGNNEKMISISISEYLSKFIAYKSKFDIGELTKLQNILFHDIKPNMGFLDKMKTCSEKMGYSNRDRNTLLGYLSQLEHGDRNYFIRYIGFLTGMNDTKTIFSENEVRKIYKFKNSFDQYYLNGFLIGKVNYEKNGHIEEVFGNFDYEYQINNTKKKYKSFRVTFDSHDYWKRKPVKVCGSVKIYVDGSEIYNKEIYNNSPQSVMINLNGASKIRIKASGLLFGVINPTFIPE